MNDPKSNKIGFIKLQRSPKVLAIIKKRPTAFLLLILIAWRARRTNVEYYDELKIGEACIGDYNSYRATEQIYKSDKKFLEKHRIATFTSTTEGTIARIVDTSIFDINEETPTTNTTDSQLTTSELPTTNKNDNNDKNVNSRLEKSQTYKNNDLITNPKSFLPTTEGETAAFEAWKKLEPLNPLAFQTTYLSAYKKGLPANLFYQFVSEIQQDPNIRTKGAVFRKKVEDCLIKKNE